MLGSTVATGSSAALAHCKDSETALYQKMAVVSEGGRSSPTRSESLRTFVRLPLAELLEEPQPMPVYQRIAARARELRLQGRSDHSIAVEFGVADQTVAKAIRWFDDGSASSA